VARALAVRLAVLALALPAVPSAALAHRLDEYLQATLVGIEPGGIKLMINLTPGVEVAEEVLARIDFNRDGLISASETATYFELVRRDLTLRLDADGLELEAVTAAMPTPAELRTGEGIIQFELAVATSLAAGRHVLVLENRHHPRIGVYLFNAALPAARSIEIARQQRNDDQSIGEIEFKFTPAPGSPAGR
jgi:hypothetical protein